VHVMSRKERGAVHVRYEQSDRKDACGEQMGELSSTCDEQRARDVQRGAAVYVMSRVRGSDSGGEQKVEGGSACDEQRGKRCAEGSSSVCKEQNERKRCMWGSCACMYATSRGARCAEASSSVWNEQSARKRFMW
jgi:hypothetical protein